LKNQHYFCYNAALITESYQGVTMPATITAPQSETNVDAAFFRENGYILVKGLFPRAEIGGYEGDFDRIVAQLVASGENVNARWNSPQTDRIAERETVVVHTHCIEKYSPIWLRMLTDARFLDRVERLIGPDIVLNHTKLFQKPPERGAPFPAHQDWNYFPTRKDSMIAAIVHLSDATDEMGCVRVFPGSHRIGRMADSMGYGEELARRFPLAEGLPIVAEPGDVLFFHYFTVHGSMPNRSKRTRKTVLVQMYAGDDEVEGQNRHLDACLSLRGWNHCMTRDKAGR
jgi:ectoine hydroxylase-related dioxygenase (phytanoyl-CoA dioxygenase family)